MANKQRDAQLSLNVDEGAVIWDCKLRVVEVPMIFKLEISTKGGVSGDVEGHTLEKFEF